MADKIVLTHPVTKGTTTVLANGSARRVLEARGWTAATVATAATAVDPSPLASKSRRELDEIALGSGISPTEFRNRADLAAAIAERLDGVRAATTPDSEVGGTDD